MYRQFYGTFLPQALMVDARTNLGGIYSPTLLIVSIATSIQYNWLKCKHMSG